ncbi:hypothetical protein AL013_04195 [Mariprofundus ferrooxydans]|uniref:Uncharacterized protein n=1 Tax=Mariprofundus ferrooxydans PV-1 TaxID=314345 RepID=Q0F3H2_9PROT|nr:hypothetical protein SPV1_04093 [Mariprofundus ferrooxydans PV-1]KON48242.1 hypothetical protein AL013_04195 [Mariprofundus ferrooxydans]
MVYRSFGANGAMPELLVSRLNFYRRSLGLQSYDVNYVMGSVSSDFAGNDFVVSIITMYAPCIMIGPLLILTMFERLLINDSPV